MSKALFVTGTGTDTGKTYITGLIVKKLQEAKKDLADQIVSKGGISFGELTKDDILKMIEESRP